MPEQLRAFFHGRPELHSFGLRVNGCMLFHAEDLERRKALGRPRLTRHPYVLHLAHRGQVEICHPRLGTRLLGARDYWMVLPGELIAYDRISKDWLHCFISFHLERPEEMAGRFSGERVFGKLESSCPAVRLFKEFARAAPSGVPRLERQLPGLLHQLIDDLFPKVPQTSADPYQPLISKLIETISRDLERDWDFRLAARDSGISYSLLRQKFREVTGLPPHQFVIRERINRACRYLNEGCSVQEAGEKAGISNPYYFSRLFKKITGVAPRDYGLP